LIPAARRVFVEQRKHDRVPVKVPLYITLEKGPYQKAIPLQSKDISTGGLCFETKHLIPLEADSMILVERLGDLEPGARIRGRVAHREKDRVTGRYTVGVEFTDFINLTPESLLARIQNW
jgi:hypothetical protein